MKKIAKVNKMLWLALLAPTIIILSSFIGNTEPTSTNPNGDNDTVETLNTSGVKINHIKDGEWSKDFPNVKFDDITYNRKGRRNAQIRAGSFDELSVSNGCFRVKN